jgi:NAD+ diphosphatase
MNDRTTPAPAWIAFGGGTLDRAHNLRNDEDEARLRRLESSRAVLVAPDAEVAVTQAGTLCLFPVTSLPPDAPLTFLGLDPSGAAMFAFDTVYRGAPDTQPYASLRALAAELEGAEGALAAYALAMVRWHRVNRFCGRSGDATVVEAAGHRRRCPGCGLVVFPRTDPAVTMLVIAGERCLLSRRHGAPEHRWSALAGFVEPGETLEEAVAREAHEETGIEIAGVEYVAAQPWPFPAALMIGFWAFADPGDETTPTPEPEELVDARWWERGELRAALAEQRIGIPPEGTIGNYLITTWLIGAPQAPSLRRVPARQRAV